MSFGTPQYGNNNDSFYKNFRLKSPDAAKGETVFSLILRLLPPMHSLAENGKWGFYHGQHFGYAGNGKEPGKVRQRPFACIEKTDFRTKMVTVACEACDRIEKKREERDAREAEYKAKGLAEKEIKDLLGPLTDWLKKHNCDRKWHINVMDQQGAFGVLQISHTLKKLLDVKIQALIADENIDPMMPQQGVWFKFTRMGKFPVQDGVEVLTETVKIEGVGNVKRIVLAPLTDAQCEAALKVCPDLAKDVVKYISAPQITALVNCSGDPDEVDRIWQMGTASPTRAERSPVPVQKPAADVSEIDRLKAELARLQNSQPKAETPKVEAAPVAETPVQNESGDDAEMSDEEFATKYGISK